jgi:XRE family transcriptional regulator, regulator of sulfur utilization
MNSLTCLATFGALLGAISVQASDAPKAPSPKLECAVYDWEKLVATPAPNGVRRAVFDGPTATVDKIHCHITTLNPGERSGAPSLHLQEEVIIVREGMIEATFNGQTSIGGPGSVIFFAAHSVTALRNVGQTPATYTVIYYYTPLTPKS